MPSSTEQVLFPEHYARGDQPVELRFPPGSGMLYEDVLGESEVSILAAQLSGATQSRKAASRGWGGDRYGVLRTPEGPALIWYVVWDDPRSAERFTTGFGEKLRRTERTGYRASFERLEMEGKPATRYLLAPEAWQGWENPPRPRVEP